MKRYILQVTSCSDSRLWYKKHIGMYFGVHGQPLEPDGYPVRDTDGYRNYVREADCRVYQLVERNVDELS